MKKIVTLTLILSLIIGFNACKKDTSLTEKKQNTDPTEQKILNFKAKMQNPNKINETMSIDSAVWYIEAALNYTYCIASEEEIGDGFNFNTLKDSLSVNADVNNELINLQEIISVYYEITNHLLNKLNTLKREKQFINIVDIDFKDNQFSARYKIKYKDTENGEKRLYSITDRWYPGSDDGNCSQTVLNRNLTDEIEKWLSHNRSVLANVYYTNIEFEGILYSYTPEIQDLWYDEPNWCHNIYSYYDHIEFYFDSFESDVYVSLPNRFKHTCPEVAYENYCAEEINQGITWAEEYLLGPGRVITEVDVMEASNQRYHQYPNGDEHYNYYQMHREYIYSGIPHSNGGQSQ